MLGKMRMQKICFWIVLEVFVNADHSVLEMAKKKLADELQRLQRLSGQVECSWVQRLLLEDLYRFFLLLD